MRMGGWLNTVVSKKEQIYLKQIVFRFNMWHFILMFNATSEFENLDQPKERHLLGDATAKCLIHEHTYNFPHLKLFWHHCDGLLYFCKLLCLSCSFTILLVNCMSLIMSLLAVMLQMLRISDNFTRHCPLDKGGRRVCGSFYLCTSSLVYDFLENGPFVLNTRAFAQGGNCALT